MKITQLGIVVCTLSTGLIVSGDVWPTSGDVKDIDIIVRKKTNSSVSVHADQVTFTSDAAASRAVATKGVSGILPVFDGDVDVTEISPETDGDVNVTNATTKTVNNSRSNIKGNMTVNEVGVADIMAEGDVNVTNASTKTINVSRSNIKNNLAVNDGVNVVSETQLSTAVSGNVVFADARSLDVTEGTAMMGNSICTSAFEGATGVTVVNMNNGHNSSIQSPMSIIVTPR